MPIGSTALRSRTLNSPNVWMRVFAIHKCTRQPLKPSSRMLSIQTIKIILPFCMNTKPQPTTVNGWAGASPQKPNGKKPRAERMGDFIRGAIRWIVPTPVISTATRRRTAHPIQLDRDAATAAIAKQIWWTPIRAAQVPMVR